MSYPLDATHDPALTSWVASANAPNTDFPIQNLPFGRIRRAGVDEPWRIGVAIGDSVLDLKLAIELAPWGDDARELMLPLAAGDLNAHMACSPGERRLLRAALSAALATGSEVEPWLELCVLPQAGLEMALPCAFAEYTDFYTSIHHALALGKLLRPDQPLLPNYKWLPIAHHARSSSLRVGGEPLRRPNGQVRHDVAEPRFGPSRRLDFELELAAVVGTGNALGTPVELAEAEDHLFGLLLLNDWSARDVQSWEYQPLGPFLAKNFMTSLSPWLVTMEALAPFRRPHVRPAADPPPMPYLDSLEHRAQGGIDIRLEAWLQSAAMRARGEAAVRITQSNFGDAYWTLAQMVAHHTVGGCNLQSGDVLGSGAQSGPGEGQGGSLMELTTGGRHPLLLPGGEPRRFLEDGDSLTLRAHCERPGQRRIGFGACEGTVLAAHPLAQLAPLATSTPPAPLVDPGQG